MSLDEIKQSLAAQGFTKLYHEEASNTQQLEVVADRFRASEGRENAWH